MKNNTLVSDLELQAAKILVVDDEDAYVRVMEWALRNANFLNFRSVTDSTQVAALFTEYQPDVVLLDLNMPKLDGIGVLQQIRELETSGDFVPVLVLTGEGGAEARTRALAAGASDFLNKPVDFATLNLRINNALQTRFLHKKIKALQAEVASLTGRAINT